MNDELREPKFCKLIPIAKGVCFGLVSLKIVLILIATVDITIGAASIGIGIIAFLKFNLPAILLAFSILNGICLALALGSIIAITTRSMRLLRFYYLWKCVEVIAFPIFEIAIFYTASLSNQVHSQLTHHQTINYYVLVVAKCVIRLYFAFLIFSYFMRIDRGESLLVEYGERRLSKMID